MRGTTVESKLVEEGFAGQQMIVLPPDLLRGIAHNPLINTLYFTAIGYYPNAAYHYRSRAQGSKQYILMYCIEGKGFVNFNQESYTLLPNTYIILPREVAHNYGSSSENPWSIYWMHFSGSNAAVLFDRYQQHYPVKPATIAYDAHRVQLFSAILKNLASSLNDEIVELAHFSFSQLITSFIFPAMQDTAAANDQVSKVLNFMKENITGKFKISDFASTAKLSVSRYSDIFKKKTGFSPVVYFNRLKIQQACQLLFFSELNIKEISAKVGIDDPYYFSRLFKNQMGISPANYRKVYKK